MCADDGRCFAAMIKAGSAAAHIDWRSDYEALSYEVTKVPAEVRRKVQTLMNDLGLRFGALDLLVTPEAGGFSWKSTLTGSGTGSRSRQGCRSRALSLTRLPRRRWHDHGAGQLRRHGAGRLSAAQARRRTDCLRRAAFRTMAGRLRMGATARVRAPVLPRPGAQRPLRHNRLGQSRTAGRVAARRLH